MIVVKVRKEIVDSLEFRKVFNFEDEVSRFKIDKF